MDDAETEIWLWSVWVASLGGNKPESTARVESLWFAGEEAGLLEVDFECLEMELTSRTPRGLPGHRRGVKTHKSVP